MSFTYVLAVIMMIVISKSTQLSVKHVTVTLLDQHAYIVSDINYQIGFAISVSNLKSCIYACHNHDFCRTAVFNSQLSVCSLYEECGSYGQIIFDITATLISLNLCSGQPENMIFMSSTVSVQTVMSNLQWIKDLTSLPACWYPFFVNNYLYVPIVNGINVYETDTYTLVRSIQIPLTSDILIARGDSQGTFIYGQSNNPNIYIYSLSQNILTQIQSSWTDFRICYSTSFLVITSASISQVDVYLRSITNNSVTFLYRIGGWSLLHNCAIIKDQQLIGANIYGGMQTTMLSTTSYNSTIVTLPLTTSHLPTGAMVTMDAAGRLYVGSAMAGPASMVFLPNGTLIGIHTGTADFVGKANKYKFIFFSSNVDALSIYEYKP